VPHSDELEHPFVVNRGRCIQIKKCIWLQFSRICSREVTPLLSVVFRVVRVVHKFDFRLVTDETPNRWRPGWRQVSQWERRTCFWPGLYVLPWTLSRALRDSTKAGQSTAFSWVKTG